VRNKQRNAEHNRRCSLKGSLDERIERMDEVKGTAVM
jgi:hypothetical protein